QDSTETKVIDQIHAFQTGITQPIEWRIAQLNRLIDLLNEQEDAIVDALQQDLRKPKFETLMTEVIVAKNEATYAINNVHAWSKPTYPSKTFPQLMDTVYIQKQPLGVVLLIGAWNYPIQLLFNQLVAVIVSGNCGIIKPSELSPVTADLIAKLIPQYLDKECFKVYLGGIPETTLLLQQKFDKIIYTGSSMVGKIIMKAAAEHLTPVLLELGGKSPVYVHKDSNLDLGITVAKRVAWGKYMNLGQTCTAPDYVLCHGHVLEEFLNKLKSTIKEMYGEDPQKSPDLARIVNARNFQRIEKLILGMSKEKLVVGGDMNEKTRYIAPTVYKDVHIGDPIMDSEIFGPILPVLAVNGEDEAIEIINGSDKPLAFYIFAKSDKVVQKLLSNTSSGGATVNDVLMHAAAYNLPFGGVGNSGMGAYHGKYSFDALTHERSISYRGQNLESLVAARYPPYTEKNLSMIRWMTTDKRGRMCSIL
uniref:Aldehyde dehydrogenase n=1 Tax=Ciona intestinalis TaxID=7719 RepID=F6Q7A6_CIOIN